MRIEMFTKRTPSELADACWGAGGGCPTGNTFECPFSVPFGNLENPPCWAVTEDMWADLELRHVDVGDGFCSICRFADEDGRCAYAGPGEKPCRKKLSEEWSEAGGKPSEGEPSCLSPAETSKSEI